MANTPNLNLPLIDDNMVADVTLRLNALAQAVDIAVVEAIEDVSIPLINAVDSTSITSAPTANALRMVSDNVIAHKAGSVTSAGGVHGLIIETGTFTPHIGGTGGGSPTHATQAGFYHCIGDLVHIDLIISLSAKNTMTGQLVISGLPFVAANVTNMFSNLTVGSVSNVALTSNGYAVQVSLSPGLNNFYILLAVNGGNYTVLRDTDISDSFSIRISGNYKK